MITSLKITTALIKRRRPDFEFTLFRDTPVTPLCRPLNKCKLAIVTTGGLYLKTDRPFDPSLKDGDCSYRVLPGDINFENLMISHKWYNHKFIHADLNCLFPIDRMKEYVQKGVIKSLSEEHYSFMGHIYDTVPLMRHAKKVGKRLKDLDVDVAFLTPA